MNIFFTILFILITVIGGYFIGNISFARIIAKKKGIDITSEGSKNPGGTNVGRVVGKKEGLKVMLYDILKAFIPCFILLIIINYAPIPFINVKHIKEIILGLLGVFICIGHAYPVLYHFKGGKCVACAAGFILAYSPIILFILFISFIICLKITKKLSICSLFVSIFSLVLLLVPVLLDIFVNNQLNYFNGGTYFGPSFNFHITYITFIYQSINSSLIIIRHISNIKRIINHTETNTVFKSSN